MSEVHEVITGSHKINRVCLFFFRFFMSVSVGGPDCGGQNQDFSRCGASVLSSLQSLSRRRRPCPHRVGS